MKQLALAVLASLALVAPAHALTAYLVAEWFKNGDQFCQYDNGTVLNVGARSCPLRIEG